MVPKTSPKRRVRQTKCIPKFAPKFGARAARAMPNSRSQSRNPLINLIRVPARTTRPSTHDKSLRSHRPCPLARSHRPLPPFLMSFPFPPSRVSNFARNNDDSRRRRPRPRSTPLQWTRPRPTSRRCASRSQRRRRSSPAFRLGSRPPAPAARP